MHHFPWKTGKLNKSCISKVRTAWIAHQLGNHVIDPEATSELSSQLLSVELAKESAAEVSRPRSTQASGSCSRQFNAAHLCCPSSSTYATQADSEVEESPVWGITLQKVDGF